MAPETTALSTSWKVKVGPKKIKRKKICHLTLPSDYCSRGRCALYVAGDCGVESTNRVSPRRGGGRTPAEAREE